MRAEFLENTPLNKSVDNPDRYSPALLAPVSRRLGRESVHLPTPLPFSGVDVWHAYEVSWLSPSGCPQIGLLELIVPALSAHLVESKSLKLYLNAINQTSFASPEMVLKTLVGDLNTLLHTTVQAQWIDSPAKLYSELAHSIDKELGISQYQPDPSILAISDAMAQETLTSSLFRSLCPVTGQPDWASIWIRYNGPKMDHDALLRYLVSYRQHRAFHETTIEQIFCDLHTHCHPIHLSVYGCFTRRGGIDINPFRSNFESAPPRFGDLRQ